MSTTTFRGRRFVYEPDYAVPPGQTLQETIDSLGIDQRELAQRTGLSPKHINQVIKGVASLSQDTAIRLERVTGVPAKMWNALEANYREQLVRLAEQERLQKDLEWLKTIPTDELLQRGVIEPQPDRMGLLEKVLEFFGVADVDAWNKGWSMPQFAFRKSLKFKGKPGAMAAWLRLCELAAQGIECCPFDRARFSIAVKAIRRLTVEEPKVFVPAMVEQCQTAGVALLLTPEIKGAPVSGAAKWLTPEKAMIGLNLRGKRDDRFWFTFFHEAGHILNDSKKETFIDVDYEDDPREQNANRFAADLLIPPDSARHLPELTTYRDVICFAESLGIAPGIVVGRLQREEIVPYSHLNRLKVTFRWG